MFTAKIISNIQNENGDLVVSVEYSNGTIPILENYPAEANGGTVLQTIASRVSQLQAAEDFVTSNPPGTEISATPIATPISTTVADQTPGAGVILKPV